MWDQCNKSSSDTQHPAYSPFKHTISMATNKQRHKAVLLVQCDSLDTGSLKPVLAVTLVVERWWSAHHATPMQNTDTALYQ